MLDSGEGSVKVNDTILMSRTQEGRLPRSWNTNHEDQLMISRLTEGISKNVHRTSPSILGSLRGPTINPIRIDQEVIGGDDHVAPARSTQTGFVINLSRRHCLKKTVQDTDPSGNQFLGNSEGIAITQLFEVRVPFEHINESFI